MTKGPFYEHGFTLISALIIDHTHHEVCFEVSYPCQNFKCATIHVC